MRAAVDDGLAMCTANHQVLRGEPGYVGHSVVLKGYDDDGVILHDPGLPPHPDRHITWDAFERAWAHAGEGSKFLYAISRR